MGGARATTRLRRDRRRAIPKPKFVLLLKLLLVLRLSLIKKVYFKKNLALALKGKCKS
jgi:hypothetical protein